MTTADFTNARNEQNIKLETANERIAIEELQVEATRTMNDAYVDEMVWRYW